MGRPASCRARQVAGAAVGHGAEVRRAADVADAAVAKVEQMACGQIAAGDVVDVGTVDGRIGHVAVDDDDRDVAGAQVGGEFCLVAGGDQQDAVDLFLDEQVQVEQLAGGVAVRVTENDAVARGEAGVLDAAADLGEEGVGAVGDDHAQGVGAFAAQRAGKGVGLEAQLGHGGFDARAQLGADGARIVNDMGDGG